MVLLVAAVTEELGELQGAPLGVGPVVAAARMATLLEQRRPEAVVMIGTAGAYTGGGLAVGQAIAARRCGLSHGVAAMGLGYVPRPPETVECAPELLDRVPDLTRADVLTVGAVTTDSVLAGRLSDGWQVEHMETFGAACACAQVGVPFMAVLGIANDVGPEAHSQWLVNRTIAQDVARAAVAAWI
ncbi:MAG: hypothetical protein GY913_16795 [Proteobacteria bacterium]|nr:hypothetical protein [Pseudomonadota bacterium]